MQLKTILREIRGQQARAFMITFTFRLTRIAQEHKGSTPEYKGKAVGVDGTAGRGWHIGLLSLDCHALGRVSAAMVMDDR